jgi:hypothetical protein
MAGENTISTLDGNFKIVYGDKLERIIPEFAKLQQIVPFDSKRKVGKRFETPVQVAMEQGVTYAEPEAGPFTIIAAIAGQTKPAYVQPYQHVLRSAIAYDASFQGEGGPEAFENSTGVVVKSMQESIRKRLEADLLGYGRSSVGRIETVTGSALTIHFTDATWAPGLWVGAEHILLDIFDSASIGTGVTKRAYAGALTSFTVESINFETKTLTLDNVTNIVNGDYVYFYGMRTATAYKCMVGLEQICTTSGTLFGVSTTDWSIFSGSSYDCGSTDLSVDSVSRAMAKNAPRGLNGKVKCWVSPKTYSNMIADVAALTRVDGKSGGQYQIGSDSIKVLCPTGEVSIEAHPMIKEGEGYLFQPSLLLRSGATDVTFNRAKIAGGVNVPDSYFRELTDAAGFEIRCYDSQFLFTIRPACFVKLINIVNS